MALTPEFISAVSARNLLRVRVMLKDSLLVDKRFCQFKEMSTYAERCGVDFWMDKTEELEMPSKTEWNMELMNLELTRLVNDFTKERLVYCQSIIDKVYDLTNYSSQTNTQQSTVSCPTTQQVLVKKQPNQTIVKKPVSSNRNDYNSILRGTSNINRILKGNKSPTGDRTWTNRDINTILDAAKKISVACENIKSRRG